MPCSVGVPFFPSALTVLSSSQPRATQRKKKWTLALRRHRRAMLIVGFFLLVSTSSKPLHDEPDKIQIRTSTIMMDKVLLSKLRQTRQVTKRCPLA